MAPIRLYFIDTNSRSETVLKIQFRILYYLAVQKRPLSDFGPMVKLFFNCSAFSEYHDVLRLALYSGQRFVREVLTRLATVVCWKTQQKLDRFPFYSVIVDGSIGHCEHDTVGYPLSHCIA